MPAPAVQFPIGVEDELEGVVDLIRWNVIISEGVNALIFFSISNVRSTQCRYRRI
jgi:hypothetical protein